MAFVGVVVVDVVVGNQFRSIYVAQIKCTSPAQAGFRLTFHAGSEMGAMKGARFRKVAHNQFPP